MERPGVVTMKGEPLTLLGPALKLADPAPAFSVRDSELNEVRLSEFAGQVVLVSAVPSVDTKVCAAQTRRFNEEAAGLPDNVAILTISMDLPFALGRFCAAEGIDRIRTLSDHAEASFGTAYGVLIKGLRLLARSIFVIDQKGEIAYMEIVPELTDHPDYGTALDAARRTAHGK